MSENNLLTQAGEDLLDPPGDAPPSDGRRLAERIGHGLGAAARAAMDGLNALTRAFRPRRPRSRQLGPADQRERLEPLLRELAEKVAAHEAAEVAADDGFWRLVREIVAIGPPPPARTETPGPTPEDDPMAGVLEGLDGDAEAQAPDKPQEKKKRKKKDDESEADEA